MLPGTLLQGRFEVEREIGAGGMGLVFQARDRLEGRPVAVKVLRGDDPTAVARFGREISVLAELRHPGIVRYVAHGESPAGDRYLVMEWLDGEDLRRRLTRALLTPAEGLRVLRQAASALASAHERGLIHRDVKPGNLFLVGGDVDRVRLLDFGVARLVDDADPLTAGGLLVGTPGYMAPEQALGLAVRHPSADVFSLGCVLFECLTGRRAFRGADVVALLAKVQLQAVPSVRALRPDLPEALDLLLGRMMARDPEARPADAGEVVEAIDALGGHVTAPGMEISIAGPPSGQTVELRGSSDQTRSATLTLNEQRIVSVVLAQAPLPGPEGERGSTAEARAGAARAVERYGGHLDVLRNGAMLVTLWGPGSAMDRAIRAGRSAVALLAHCPGASVCVVTGRGVVSARVVEGSVIDRAADALRVAPPGVVYVDAATAGLLDRRFVLEPAPAGGEGFLLRGERERTQAAPRLLGKATPFVGRGRELALLEAEVDACATERTAAAVLVTGDAGSGKSRLCRELLEKIRASRAVVVLSGRADSVGDRAPFGVVASAIRGAAGVHGGEPLEVLRGKLAVRLGRRVGASRLARVCAFLGEMAGIPFPDESAPALRAARGNAQIMGDAMRAAWEEWLSAECAAGPVALVLEDLHWGDVASIRLVDATLRNLRDLPLLVLGLARPELSARFHALWVGRGVREIKLGPLGRKPSVELVRAALGPGAAVDLVARVVEHADGNPFYLEELVRAVARGSGETFPDSVLGTVEARLDAEGTEAKRILRAASVFGERFTAPGVLALLGGAGTTQDEVRAALDRLAARELVVAPGRDGPPPSLPAPPSPSGEREERDDPFVFGHALVREAAYATLTEDDRALGHRLAGAWLEARGGADAAALADHFVRGGEPARAVRWCLRSAQQALAADDLAEAIARARRGAASGAAGEALGALRLVEAEAHLWLGEIARAEALAADASALFPEGSAGWFQGLYQEVVAAGKLGHADRVEARFARTGDVAAAADGASQAARVSFLCASASNLVFGGRYFVAEAAFACLEVSAIGDLAGTAPTGHAGPPPPSDPQSDALIRQTRSFLASARGDSGACLEGLTETLAAFERAEDRRNACMTRVNLGFVQAELGAFAAAEGTLRAALSTADRMGLHDVAAVAQNNLGHVLCCQGRLDEARRLQRQSIETHRSQEASREEGMGRIYLAQIELLAGDVPAALREARAAAAVLHAMPPLRALATAVLARALLAEGRSAEAIEAARAAYAELTGLGSIEEGEATVRLVYAEALAARGLGPAALGAVAEARDRLLARAAKISDPVWRERFLTCVPDNARTLALSSETRR